MKMYIVQNSRVKENCDISFRCILSLSQKNLHSYFIFSEKKKKKIAWRQNKLEINYILFVAVELATLILSIFLTDSLN